LIRLYVWPKSMWAGCVMAENKQQIISDGCSFQAFFPPGLRAESQTSGNT